MPTPSVINNWHYSKAINRRVWDEKYARFDWLYEPVTAKKAGGAAGGTAGDENLMITPEGQKEYHILGTQTITAPSLVSVSEGVSALNINMDQTDNDGVEICAGIMNSNRNAFKVGTDAAFYYKVRFSIADVSGTDDCAVGFRKVEAYQANIDDYADMAVLNVISGDIKIETIVGGAATTTTDTTDNWADGETHTLAVFVDGDGAVTYQIDEADPTTTAAFSFTADLFVVPFIYLLNSTDVAGEVNVLWEECGYQS